MPTYNVAYTGAINPAGATPQLTAAQVWAGLQRKVRHAEEFVSVITACRVVDETTRDDGGAVVTREATFTPESALRSGGRSVVTEVCHHYAPSRVDFRQEDGSSIQNIISRGADGRLLMTYVFEWRRPDVEDGSDKAAEMAESYSNVGRRFPLFFLLLSHASKGRAWRADVASQGAKIAVESSIDAIRGMVKEGKL